MNKEDRCVLVSIARGGGGGGKETAKEKRKPEAEK